MRIALLTSFYEPHKGGTERYVADLGAHLAKRGHEVTVFTHTRGSSRTHAGVRIERLWAFWLLYTPLLRKRVAASLQGFDVIHSHIPPSVFAEEGPFPAQVPHIITYHCDTLIPPRFRGIKIPALLRGRINTVLRHKAERVLRQANAIIVTSWDYALTSEVLQGLRVVPIPVGINAQRFASAAASGTVSVMPGYASAV
ncbi:MAG: glycosyltransferase family 4 protein, partial [Spirochaetota bacterium]